MTNTDTPATPGENTDTAATLLANDAPATETPATETPATETKPEFVIPGVPRRYWGALCKAAEKADKDATEAEAEADEAEGRHRACLDSLSNAAEIEAEAEDAAAVAKGRAKVAAEAVERATSKEELHERKREAAAADEAAGEAEKNAAAVKAQIAGKRCSAERLRIEVQNKREKASKLRSEADSARRRAEDNEVPRLLDYIARREASQLRTREVGVLRAAREHLPRVECRNCRFWDPVVDPRIGKCHARPPTINNNNDSAIWANTTAADWCAVGEPIPAADADTPAADTPADTPDADTPDADTPDA